MSLLLLLLLPLLLLLALAVRSDATRLSGRPGPAPSSLRRRTSLSGTMSQLGVSQNIAYTINITLNNEPFSVLIDTGSSDLWVSQPVPSAVPQNYQAGVTYASGSANGDVNAATLEFDGYSIDSQFYIEAPDGNAAGGAGGLIGLGPGSLSAIRAQGNSSAANPPLDRIFASNSSIDPTLAILLQRSDDPDEPYPGELTIGQVLTDYKDVLNQPRLPVSLASLQGGQHWQISSFDGIIGSDGNLIEIQTQVTGAQGQNATIVFDTGFTLPQVPGDVARAIYGGFPNAVLKNVSSLGEIYVLPCEQEINITFLYGGVQFPIHPLDTNFDGFGLQDDKGNPTCVGAFQPYSFDISADGNIPFDVIAGMAMLRNAYMMINFGNLVDSASPSADTAYIQLLPTTNSTQASQDFQKVRGGSGASPVGSAGNQPGSHSSSKPWTGLRIAVIAGVGVVIALLVAGITYFRRRRRRHAQTTTWVPSATGYRPIHDPSPQAAYDMHVAPGGSPGYTSQYVNEYRTAWDARY